jgi:hypothetical protein
MIPEPLVQLESELRQACVQQRYGAVEHLALEFGDAARREIAKLKPGDASIARIAQHVLSVLEWSRLITLTGRARTAGELRGIPFLNRYLSRSLPRPPTVRIDA